MKVNIGPYKYGLGVRRLVDVLQYLGVREETCRKIANKLQYTVIGDVVRYFNDKSIDNRKIKVIVDDYDVWGADSTLAYIIVPVLKKLKTKAQGAPYVANEDVPANLHGPADVGYDIDDKHFDRWDYVLNEMIWAFEQINYEDRENQFYSGDIDFTFTKQKDGNSLMEYGPNHTHKVDRIAQKEYEARIANGIRLFGKYYQNLWT